MSKFIELSQGYTTEVDDEFFDYLNQWKWYCEKGGYAVRNSRIDEGIGDKNIYMHRVIMGDPYRTNGMDVDHIDSNKRNNKVSNLRWATHQQNLRNKVIRSSNKTGYIGVSTHSFYKNKWRARIMVDGKEIGLGLFPSIKEAAIAYNNKAIELFGKYAKLNEIKE